MVRGLAQASGFFYDLFLESYTTTFYSLIHCIKSNWKMVNFVKWENFYCDVQGQENTSQ